MPDHATDNPLLHRYADYAPNYDQRWARYSNATLAYAQSLFEEHAQNAEQLIDVGCGTGLFAQRLRDAGTTMQILGLDLSPEMLEIARKRFADDPHTRFREASAESLPAESDHFDVLTCTNALHLITDHRQALLEFSRVLKPDGLLIIVDWNRDAVTIKALSAGYRFFGSHPRTIRTASQLREIVEAAGFAIVEAKPFRATWFWKMTGVVARNVM